MLLLPQMGRLLRQPHLLGMKDSACLSSFIVFCWGGGQLSRDQGKAQHYLFSLKFNDLPPKKPVCIRDTKVELGTWMECLIVQKQWTVPSAAQHTHLVDFRVAFHLGDGRGK